MGIITFNKVLFVSQAKINTELACFKLNKFSDAFELKVNSIEDAVASEDISPQMAVDILLKSYDKAVVKKYLNLRILNNQHQIKHAYNPVASGCFFESDGSPPSADEITMESKKYILAEKAILKALEQTKRQAPIPIPPSSAPKHYPRRMSPSV